MGKSSANKHSQFHLKAEWADTVENSFDEFDDFEETEPWDDDTSPQTRPLPLALLDFTAIDNASLVAYEDTKSRRQPHQDRHGIKLVKTARSTKFLQTRHQLENHDLQVKGMEDKVSTPVSKHNSPNRCTEQLTNAEIGPSKNVFPSNLGPAPRGLLVVKARQKRAFALISFQTGDSHSNVAFIGNSGPTQDSFVQEFQTQLRQLTQGSNHNDLQELSQQMTLLAPTWSSLLEEYTAGTDTIQSCYDRGDLLRKALERSKRLAGVSLDTYGMFELYLEQGGISHKRTEVQLECAGDGITPNEACLICLDHLPVNDAAYFQLNGCAHRVCSECWVDYVRSVAASGHSATISCPAHKCTSSIDLTDIPHILFGNDAATSSEEAQSLFCTVALNECQDFCIRKKSGRYCSSLACDRILLPAMEEKHERGWNIIICSCGATQCADCPRDFGAHPGVTCSQHAKIMEDIESGRADAEYQSYQFVMKYSRPCPRCGSAIERNGGCNHIMCSKCTYYFCWQCGGPGSECMSYLCKNSVKFWHQEPDDKESDFDKLASKVMIYRSYRSSFDRLRRLDVKMKSLCCDTEKDCDDPIRTRQLVLERQILQAMLWLRSYFLHNFDCEPSGDLSRPWKQLELIDHAHLLRTHISLNNESCAADGSFTQKQVAKAMGVVFDKKGKKIAQRHKKSIEIKHQQPTTKPSFAEIIADKELQALTILPEESFCRAAREAIDAAVNFLSVQSSAKTKAAQRRPRRNVASEQTIGCAELNKRKDRARDPWKNGMRVADSGSPSEAAGTVRWSGKERVRVRRDHALEKFA
jgi:IBR domain, a half RING-finger domain